MECDDAGTWKWCLVPHSDTVFWALENFGKYSAHSLYLKLCNRALVAHAREIWELQVPLKLKIFIWQLARGGLSSLEQIKKHHGPSNGTCVLCAQAEDVAYIFFNCLLAQFMWSGLRTTLRVF
jgi:hypothetical protein